MRKSILIMSMLFVNSFLFSQITLNLTVPTSNVDQIAVYGTATEVHFSTATDYMTYNCGDFAPTDLGSAVNDIIFDEAVGNDTLSINKASSDFYYGINNTLTDGLNTHNLNTPVNAIASDGDSVYTIGKYGTQYNVVQIKEGVTNYFGSNFNALDLYTYTDIDYFELAGNRYVAIISSYGLSIYDITASEHFFTDEFSATSVSVSQGVAYFSKGNEIYEITSIGPHANPIYKTVTSTVAYTIDTGQTINEFAFGPWGGDINVAATDGIYSECSSTVSVNELKPMDGYSVFPNPNSGQFTIQGIENGATISILNSQGQLMFEQKETTESNLSLNLEFPDGMYFIKVQSNDVIQTERVIINN